MIRTITLLVLGALAIPAMSFKLAPQPIVKRAIGKPDSLKPATAPMNVLKKVGFILPTILFPLAGTVPVQASVPAAESAITQVVERGRGDTLLAGWADSLRGNARKAEPSGQEQFQLGLRELRKNLNNPREIQEALNLLKDPKYRAEVQRLQNDPGFQREFRAFTNSPEFQQAVQQAKQQINQLQNDPQALESIRNQLLR